MSHPLKMSINYLILLISISTITVDGAAPASLTPTLVAKSGYTSVTELHIGSKVEYQLTVRFPVGTVEGVIVEILPSTNVTIMAVGDTTISHNGSNLNIDANQKMVYHATSDSQDSAFKIYTRGVYTFGNVTNSGSDSANKDNDVTIDFEAFVVLLDGVSNGDTHWVSTGVEYNNSYNVWIGQMSYTLKTATPAILKTPTFNLTSPTTTEIELGSVMKVQFWGWIPYPSPNLAAEAIYLHSDAANTDMSVISLSVINVGANFDGIGKQINLEKATTTGVLCNESWTGPRRVRNELPTTLTNKESRSDSTNDATIDDLIEFEAVIYMSESATVGNLYPIGFGIEIDTTEVWVSYFNLTATAASGGNPNMNLVVEANSTACLGGVSYIYVNITTLEIGVTHFTVDIDITEKTGSKNPGFMVSLVEQIQQGQNIICSEYNASIKNTSGSNVYSSASVSFKISNFGTVTHLYGSNASVILLKATVIPLPGYVDIGDTHVVNVNISHGSNSVTDSSQEMTVSCQAPYDAPVNYNFSFYHNCTRSCLSRGSGFQFYLDITTERNKNPGPVSVELAVPTNASESFFSVCSYEVIKIGQNLKCITKDMINDATNVTTLSDGTYEWVKVVFPLMCNLGLENDTEEDKVSIKMIIKVRNDSSVDTSRDEWFGIGARYSTTQVWVAQYKICIKAPDYYPDLAIVNGISIETTDLVGNFPGVRAIEYSLDGFNFTNRDVIWQTGSGNGTHSVYNIAKPFLTTHVGMTMLPNSTCTETCYYNHELIVTELDEYLEIFNDQSKAIKAEMFKVLDKNNNTCFQLPVKKQTPPIFWARINTTVIFGITASQFNLVVTGDGISCNKHTGSRVLQVSTPASLQVSYPTGSSLGKFHGDVQFCSLAVNGEVVSGLSSCQYQCACPNPAHCEEVIVFLANDDENGSWTLCDLSASNY